MTPLTACIAWGWIGLTPAAAPAATAEPAQATVPVRPSVLVVTLDTTRADRIGCYGARPSVTPNLDALAAAGVRFDRVVSPAPLTVPAHASLFTGRVPRRHGARDNAAFLLPDGVPTLAEVLRDAGWSTAAVVGSFVLDRRAGLARGFEIYDDDVRQGERTEFAYEERAAPTVTDAALDTLGRLDPPFLLWVHYFDPHAPYVPPEPFRTLHADSPYLGELALVDRELGRLLDAVRAADPRTLITVAGDHGESLGGRSVLALASGDERPGPGRPYEIETLFPWLSYGWAPLHAIVRDDWKYVAAPRPELYDLETDPGEARERSGAETERAAAMANEIGARLAEDTVERAAQAGPEAAERRRRLGSLGYVPGGPGTTSADHEPIDPKDGVVWLADLDRARRLSAEGRPAACADALRSLLARNPDNVPALLTLASCRLAGGDASGALAAVESAERIRPRDDLIAFHRANALAALVSSGDRPPDDALKAYDRAIGLNPRRADAWLNFASFAARAAGPQAALDVLRRAGEAGVAGPDLDVTRGVQWLRLGNGGEAESAFRDALRRNPRDVQTLEAMVRLRQRADDPVGSATYLERWLEVEPRWEIARDLGAARDAAGDREGAVRAWRRAIALLPDGHPERPVLERAIAD